VTGRIALAVLGDPLAYTQSPAIHRAGLAVLGQDGASEAHRTAPGALGERLRALAARGCRGVNLTSPLKQVVLEHLDRVSEAGRAARSVNTVGFEPDGWWGDTTDGPGLVDLMGSLGRRVPGERVVLLGAGAAARSLALALRAAGAAVAASARRPGEIGGAWSGIPGARLVSWRSQEEGRALAEATVVVNSTPIRDREPVPLARVPHGALLLDLAYGPRLTPWVRMARAQGRQAYDGLGLLVFQGRRSLALWFARPVPVDPLARAVGWPR
jgi:shikimate dehydrogenase